MRNLKRALSLALASVMLMGMMVVGSSAAGYPDVDSADNVEAIEVLKAVGIMTGDASGDFNPDQKVTRNEMAVVMANLLKLSVNDFGAVSTPFTDVPSWAAKYVAACYADGIIAGTSATTFGGEESVTSVQAGLMIMKALGYFQYGPDFGDDWQLATVRQASSIDLFDGIDAGRTDALTRNEVARLVLNGLKATMVEFDGVLGTDITSSDGTTIKVGYQSKYSDMRARTGVDYTSGAKDVGTRQLCEELYGNDLKAGTTADAFERPATQWTYKGVGTVGTYATAPDATYTAEVKLGDIYKDLALSSTIAAANVDFHMDGAAETGAYTGYALSRGNSTKIGGNGVLVEAFYDDAAGTAIITLVNTYAGEVTAKRSATSSAEASITVTPLNAGRGGNFETEDFATDDIVLYTYSNKSGDTGIKSVVRAEQVTGELTGYTGTSTVVVDGTSYKVNKAASLSGTTLSGAIKNEVTLTLDAYGYVVDLDAEASSTNYAVVLKYKDSDSFDDAKAELLFTDGTTKTVYLTADVTALAGGPVEPGAIISYTVNNRDKYTLTVLDDAETKTGVITTKGNSALASINSITATNGKTIFLVATKSGSDTTYTVYNGFANVPTITVGVGATFNASAYAKSGSSAAAVVYINATADGSGASASTKDVVFVKGDASVGKSSDSVRGDYYRYDAIVNGEITKIDSATQITSKTLYTTMSVDSNDVATLGGALTTTNPAYNSNGGTGTGTVKAESNVIGLGTGFYSYADDCKVFYIDIDGNISTSSVAGISTDATNNVWFKITDNEVTTIVVQDQVSSAATFSKITYSIDNAVGVEETISASGTVTTGAAADATKTVAITGVTVAAGATWTVSGTATVVANGGTVAAANQITLIVTAEDGTTNSYVIGFQAAA